MPRIEFEADTEEELINLAWRWVMGPPRERDQRSDGAGDDETGAGGDETDPRRRQLLEVLNAIRGADSRRLVREVAELSLQGEVLVLDNALRARYGKSTGTAFAGIVAGPNKVMRRVAHRDLLTWDASGLGYRMHPADAEIVVATWS